LPAYKLLGQWHLRPATYWAYIARLEAEHLTGRESR
jgi:hypothetical protein